MRSKIARAVLIALVGTGVYVGVALLFSSPASAATAPCSDPDSLTNLPTGPTTVSVASTPDFGRVLVIGSGAYSGCSLYLLTSDQLHALNPSAPYACSATGNAKGPCDTVLWPALLTDGPPIAGPGVDPRLLGTVTRTDLPGLPAVQEVTYAGWPLYRFFRDTNPGDTAGANLNDPNTSPKGIWYLLNPRGGIPATGPAELELESAPWHRARGDRTGLTDEQRLHPVPKRAIPRLHLERRPRPLVGRRRRALEAPRQVPREHLPGRVRRFWPPVLTSGWPEAGPGVDQGAIGIIVRPDGSQQVTTTGGRCTCTTTTPIPRALGPMWAHRASMERI